MRYFLKTLGLFSLMTLSLHAEVYNAKVEPFEKYTIASETHGRVTIALESLEGSTLTKHQVVQLDDTLEQMNLRISQANLESLERIHALQKKNLKRIKGISTSSAQEIDTAEITMLNARNALLNTKYQVEQLKDTIAKKQFWIEKGFLYKLSVREGQYVTSGTKIMEVHDTSKSRLTLYINREDALNLAQKMITVEGKVGEYQVYKLIKESDESYLSSYRLELIGPAPELFSNIVTIEIKDK